MSKIKKKVVCCSFVFVIDMCAQIFFQLNDLPNVPPGAD